MTPITRFWTVAAIAVLAAVAATGSTGVGVGRSLGDGGSESGVAINVGESVTFGAVISNTGRAPMTLSRVELVPDSSHDGVEILESRAMDMMPGATALGLALGFPPHDAPISWRQARPVAGVQLPPGGERHLSLLIGVRVTKPGRWRFNAVRVTYRVGSSEYVQRIENALVLCAPATIPCDH